MKKIYISPSTLAVELRCKNHLLEGSYQIYETTTVNESDGGWTKEYNNTFPNRNVWDEEW